AWGFTNIDGVDNADLILLDIDPTNNNRYATPHGPASITERVETIRVWGASDESLVVRGTEWGPILPEPLLGRPVAVHWTALDTTATNLNLLDLDRVATTTDPLELFNNAGGSPMNAFVADNAGNIGWTLTGRIPVRSNFDGLMSRSWSDGSRHWEGYLAPQELPRLINPSSGFLINANQRMVGTEYPYVIGHGFGGGYRAYRITERLREMKEVTERDMLHLQLDTHSEFYRYYQKLALQAVSAQGVHEGADELGIKQYLEGWDGQAEKESLGFALLVEFRRVLADAVLTPLFTRCRALDRKFEYGWNIVDVPLQQVLNAQPPELLPNREHPDWDRFILAMLEQARDSLLERHHIGSLQELSWGRVSLAEIDHPLSAAIPWLGRWLNMPVEPVAGCNECVRWSVPHGGATERLVVSPGRTEEGILHMPGGQSGHLLSPFYRDQQPDWVEGRSTGLVIGEIRHHLISEPLDAPLSK
ncbi:MAG: penicillin acylase family protein, partial [Gammaproteobacteria bacterium]|nr:penicillin acylase family protein [Gammaproteobacteria bacterium]